MADSEHSEHAIKASPSVPTRRKGVRQIGTVVVAVISVSLFVAAGGWSRTHPLPAPPAGALPLPPHARVIASAPGGSAVDTGYDHNRYRYLAIAGAGGEPNTKFLASEVRFLTRHGWKGELSYVLVVGSDPAAVTRVPITGPGANVLINAPHQKIYAALDAIESWGDAEQQTDGTPLYNKRAIRRALTRHEPVLFVSLGNGRHGRL